MRKKQFRYVILTVVMGLAAMTSIGLAEEAKPAAGLFPMTLEVETFTIKDGSIVENKDASGGKAVIANEYTFVATKSVNLTQKGVYEMTVYENAPAGDTDAINVTVNDENQLRTYPDTSNYNKFAPCIKKFLYTVTQPGEIKITLFTSNEKGALYDKIVINLLKAE